MALRKKIRRKINRFRYYVIDKIRHNKFKVSIDNWFYCRFINRSDVIKIRSLDSGYHDIDSRMFHVIFDLLVEYVEVELALEEFFCDKLKQNNYKITLFERFVDRIPKWLKPEFRSRELGIKNLLWRIDDKENDPDGFYKEVYELYIWYKDNFLVREDTLDVTGWYDWCDYEKSKTGNDWNFKPHSFDKDGNVLTYVLSEEHLTEEEKEKKKEILQKGWDLDEQRSKEEEEMMIRVVKIRSGLWT